MARKKNSIAAAKNSDFNNDSVQPRKLLKTHSMLLPITERFSKKRPISLARIHQNGIILADEISQKSVLIDLFHFCSFPFSVLQLMIFVSFSKRSGNKKIKDRIRRFTSVIFPYGAAPVRSAKWSFEIKPQTNRGFNLSG
jgi:hypothetical protein